MIVKKVMEGGTGTFVHRHAERVDLGEQRTIEATVNAGQYTDRGRRGGLGPRVHLLR